MTYHCYAIGRTCYSAKHAVHCFEKLKIDTLFGDTIPGGNMGIEENPYVVELKSMSDGYFETNSKYFICYCTEILTVPFLFQVMFSQAQMKKNNKEYLLLFIDLGKICGLE